MHKQEIALPTAKSLGSKDTSILKFIKSVLNLMKLLVPSNLLLELNLL